MTDLEREKRVDELWQKARKYNNKIRFQVRIAKMAEQNQKEMMIDDNIDEEGEDWLKEQEQKKMPWYMLDAESTFIRFWNFFITLVIIYQLIINPFIQVFPTVYMQRNSDGSHVAVTKQNKAFVAVELVVDIIYSIEILLNFMKR